MGGKFKSKTHLLDTVSDFCAFFARLASKFGKSTNMTFKKVSFFNLKTWVPKNAEFHADFKSAEKVLKNCMQLKKLQAKKN
jgi:hypothetical protein